MSEQKFVRQTTGRPYDQTFDLFVLMLATWKPNIICISSSLYFCLSVYVVIPTGSSSEAMRELESIKDNETVHLCATMALIYAHKKSKSQGEYFVQNSII